jgi:hypothetical protein
MLLAVPHPIGEKNVAGADDEAAADLATGDYPDTASDLTVDLGFFKPVVVGSVIAPPAPAPTTVAPRPLSRTGSDPRVKVVLAAWMIWIGVGIVAADRRRRQRLAPPAASG